MAKDGGRNVITEDELRIVQDALKDCGGSRRAAARMLGVTPDWVFRRVKVLDTKGDPPAAKEFQVVMPPDPDIDVESLVEHRIRQFEKKQIHEEASKQIPVKIGIDGAIAILHFGDPHVDDDGTDLKALREHSDLTQREGIFGANVGDTTNNWVGRLARLYAEQSTSATQAWKLAEWFVARTRWLYMIGGNHDGWAGAGDPLNWISRQQGTLYRPSEARLRLEFPNGHKVLVNARHDFRGASMYNPAHAQMKAAQFGVRDHLLVSGHRHVSGYGVVKDPETGRICHALQVGSYKKYDRYAREKGFRDQSLGPAAMTVIDPELADDHPDLVKVFWDPDEGADYLKFKRQRLKRQQARKS